MVQVDSFKVMALFSHVYVSNIKWLPRVSLCSLYTFSRIFNRISGLDPKLWFPKHAPRSLRHHKTFQRLLQAKKLETEWWNCRFFLFMPSSPHKSRLILICFIYSVLQKSSVSKACCLKIELEINSSKIFSSAKLAFLKSSSVSKEKKSSEPLPLKFIQFSLLLTAYNIYTNLSKGHIYFINVEMTNYFSPFISKRSLLIRTIIIDLVEETDDCFLA